MKNTFQIIVLLLVIYSGISLPESVYAKEMIPFKQGVSADIQREFYYGGEKLTGRQQIDGTTFYLDEEGVLYNGIIEDEDHMYYIQDGVFVVNCQLADVEDGIYQFTGSDTKGKILSVEGYSTAKNADMILDTSFGYPSEQFEVKYLGNGWYRIVNMYSGLVLGLVENKDTFEYMAQQCEWNEADNQMWRFIDAGSGYCILQSKTGMVLGRINETQLQGETMNLSLTQTWKVQPVTAPKTIEIRNGAEYLIASAHDRNRVLDAGDATSDYGSNVQIKIESLTSMQRFRAVQVEAEWYRLESVYFNLVLDIAGDMAYDGSNVQLDTWVGDATQLWRFVDAGDGTCYIQSKTGAILECASAEMQDGTNVRVSVPEKTTTQKFVMCNTSLPNYVHVTNLTEYTSRITLYHPDEKNIQSVLFPVWTDENGQDDLMWIDGTENEEGFWSIVIDSKDFKSKGTYHIHIYMNISNGQKLVGMTQTDLDKKIREPIWPCPSSHYITSYFGYRNRPTAGASSYHRGIDIGASHGSHILSSLKVL